MAGGRLIVVDAIDDAAVGFYEHYGFAATRHDRDGDAYPRRLIMKIATARAALGG